jgi:hypothetical protein
MSTTVDWSKLLEDMAFLLGEVDDTQPGGRQPCGTRKLAQYLQVDRQTVRNLLGGCGDIPYAKGERLLAMWGTLTGKPPSFAPRAKAQISAARMNRV